MGASVTLLPVQEEWCDRGSAQSIVEIFIGDVHFGIGLKRASLQASSSAKQTSSSTRRDFQR